MDGMKKCWMTRLYIFVSVTVQFSTSPSVAADANIRTIPELKKKKKHSPHKVILRATVYNWKMTENLPKPANPPTLGGLAGRGPAGRGWMRVREFLP